ncbi:MAG TPA: asparagine synthase-related protein [Acidimicrobiales bacterium]|nr:asparagine synthase-related protein [Acidimicrobiales bacterium]
MPRLSPLEVATSEILGEELEPAALPRPSPTTTARAALEEVVMEGLLRPPCVVAFSGGRDSSAVLGVATHVARREGLPLPVPVTYQWPGLIETDEGEWQEMVVRHLRLPEWCRLRLDDELDLLGPLATRVLARYGLMWPPTSHMQLPLVEQAKGGSLLTGEGGDELFGPHRSHALAAVLGHGVRPPPRAVRKSLLAVVPRRPRTRVLAWRLRPKYAWLRPEPSRQLGAARAAVASREPVRRDRFLAWHLRRRRERDVWEWWGRTLAAEHDVSYREPLLEPAFVGALAAEVGWRGYADRTSAMLHLFGDLLPTPLIGRTSKAGFGDVYFHRHARSFCRQWRGDGLDPAMVDLDGLRATWNSAKPPPATWTLLQAAWLVNRAHLSS